MRVVVIAKMSNAIEGRGGLLEVSGYVYSAARMGKAERGSHEEGRNNFCDAGCRCGVDRSPRLIPIS